MRKYGGNVIYVEASGVHVFAQEREAVQTVQIVNQIKSADGI